jgi:hypothetical protein
LVSSIYQNPLLLIESQLPPGAGHFGRAEVDGHPHDIAGVIDGEMAFSANIEEISP